MIYPEYTILIDTNEMRPFRFRNLVGDAKDRFEPIAVMTERKCLGRHPVGLGDYSIKGHELRVCIERKSVEDIQSTVLGWSGRRDRFKQELLNFSKIEFAAVVIEGTLCEVLDTMPEWGSKSRELNRKIFDRSQLAFRQDYTAQWLYCCGREHAEETAFRWLDRYWRRYANGK